MRKYLWLGLFFIVSSNYAATSYFAAGCFWSAEHDFSSVPGVEKVVSGYIGGHVMNPTYDQVLQGGTGHYEAVEVTYDPKKVSYKQLLDVFWHDIDPTDTEGQFCDKGQQYRSAIFYTDEKEKAAAEESKEALTKRFKNVTTMILPASSFYPAEEYHQDYADKHSVRYKLYRYMCGRDAKLKEIWK